MVAATPPMVEQKTSGLDVPQLPESQENQIQSQLLPVEPANPVAAVSQPPFLLHTAASRRQVPVPQARAFDAPDQLLSGHVRVDQELNHVVNLIINELKSCQ